jgi:hypothetical protein
MTTDARAMLHGPLTSCPPLVYAENPHSDRVLHALLHMSTGPKTLNSIERHSS